MCKLLVSWKSDAGIWLQIGRPYYVLVGGLSRESETTSSNTISCKAGTVSLQPIWYKNDRPWIGILYRTVAAIWEMLQLGSGHLLAQSAFMQYRPLVLVLGPWTGRASGRGRNPHRGVGHLDQDPTFTRQLPQLTTCVPKLHPRYGWDLVAVHRIYQGHMT